MEDQSTTVSILLTEMNNQNLSSSSSRSSSSLPQYYSCPHNSAFPRYEIPSIRYESKFTYENVCFPASTKLTRMDLCKSTVLRGSGFAVKKNKGRRVRKRKKDNELIFDFEKVDLRIFYKKLMSSSFPFVIPRGILEMVISYLIGSPGMTITANGLIVHVKPCRLLPVFKLRKRLQHYSPLNVVTAELQKSLNFLHFFCAASTGNFFSEAGEDYFSRERLPPFSSSRNDLSFSQGRLFGYQRKSVLWGLEVERRAAQREGYNLPTGGICIPGTNLTTAIQCTRREEFKHYFPVQFIGCSSFESSDEADEDAVIQMVRSKPTVLAMSRGAILADEVGLGKTTTLLGIIASSTRKEETKEGGRGRATVPSLVVVPRHLCHQWEAETKKFYPDQVCPFQLRSVHDHRRFSNMWFKKNRDKKYLIIATVDFLKRHFKRKRVREKTNRSWDVYEPTGELLVPLENIFFERVILDEGHECLMGVQGLRMNGDLGFLSRLRGRFFWYVSATPFPKNFLIPAVAKFLRVSFVTHPDAKRRPPEEYTASLVHHRWLEFPIGKLFFLLLQRHLFRRNVRSTVQKFGENFTPKLHSSIVRFRFSPVERFIYDTIVDLKPFSTWKKKAMACCTILNKHLMVEFQDLYRSLREAVVVAEQKSAILRHVHHNLANRILYLETAHNRDDGDSPQLIPSSSPPPPPPIPEDEASSSSSRAPPASSESASAPTTLRDEIRKLRKQLQTKTEQLEKAEQRTDRLRCAVSRFPTGPEMQRRMREYAFGLDPVTYEATLSNGTKLAQVSEHVIRLLLENNDNRIVIFSRHNNLLTRMKMLCELQNIPTVSARGNVFVKRNALRTFQEHDDYNDNTREEDDKKGKKKRGRKRKRNNKTENGENRVLLLSLEDTASGSDLTAVTHILIVDQNSWDKGLMQQVAKQARGRVMRQCKRTEANIVYFVIEDTIEDEAFFVPNGEE